MKRILVVCPTGREYRDLPAIAESLDYELLFDDFAGDYFDRFHSLSGDACGALEIIPLIDETIARHRHANLSGVTSAVGYPGMSVASIMAARLGLTGPRPEAVLLCEHKYYSRVAQQKLVPQATPQFHLIDPLDPATVERVPQLPAFLKPVKSCMSMNAYRVSSREDLRALARSALLPRGFLTPFNDMLAAYSEFELDVSYLLVESLLEGLQVSLEGYVYQGSVQIMGIIDAIMFPGTMSFKRFQYPSGLPEHVQQRMAKIASDFIRGIGYDNAMFNIELIYNPNTDDIHIIEVNPKIASQFPDLFEKVDGTSSYAVLLQLAAGEEPHFTYRQGKHKLAASCVLRTFTDQLVLRVPSAKETAAVLAEFPDARVQIIATEGKNLSDQMQDANSYRYGLVNIGADSEEELETNFELCKNILNFQLAPASRPMAAGAAVLSGV